MTFQELIDEIEIWDDWQNRYKHWVPKFIEEAKTKTNWNDWDVDIFNEFFEKSNNQCVSSLQQGYFSHDEQFAIKENWLLIAPKLKMISESQDVPLWEAYEEIQQEIRKHTSSNKKAATYRLIAGLQPNLLCTIVKENDLSNLIDYLQENITDVAIVNNGNWFRNSFNICQLFRNGVENTEPSDLITLPWQVKIYFEEKLKSSSTYNDKMEKQSNEIVSLLKYKKQIILQGPPGTGKTKLAKEIAQQLIEIGGESVIVQFHPAYSYEDFVRGISAISNGACIEYKTIDKTLINFANRANINYQKYLNNNSKNSWVTTQINKYKAHIEEQFFNCSKYYLKEASITTPSFIDTAKDEYFRLNNDEYSGQGFVFKYTEFNEVINSMPLNANYSSISIPNTKGLYRKLLIPLLTDFQLFNGTIPEFEDNKLEYFVLIIDEINRANLSSVLGELIYALEYRGEAVKSMYAIEGDHELVLPPNLYIIGTMNTADRSVGNIDYAIRRRFAFVDVLPNDLSAELGDKFHKTLFEQVSGLFKHEAHLSNEFKPKDVQLGHSYFIDKTEEGGSMDIRLQYEIKPILLEYVKDGILIGDKIENIIIGLSV